MTPRRRIPALLAVVAVTATYLILALRQEPRLYFDSAVFLETAAQPWSWSHLFYPKPPVVPRIYALLGGDPDVIVVAQTLLVLGAWVAFAAVLVSTLTSTRARIAAGIAMALFLLAPSRVGYTHAVLSETISDALLVGCVALVVRMLARPSVGRATAAAVAIIAWTWTRDTNAVVAIVATLAGVGLARRTVRTTPSLLAPAAAVIVSASVVIWTTTVTPPPTGLTVHVAMPEDFTARKTYPTFNNISDRLRDPEAVAFFVARGMPQAEELVELYERDQQIYLDPHFWPARSWIVHHASGVYLSWLVRDPLARLREVFRDAPTLLGVVNQHVYMPKGWTKSVKPLRWVRAATESGVVVLALLLVLPFALRRRRSALGWLGIVLTASGFLGCLAAYYGDSLERARHCYGAGQQVVIGLVLCVLAWLDQCREERLR